MPETPEQRMLRDVAAKQERMLRARRGGDRRDWSPLSFLGMVGWSVVLPMLGGVALGVWLDGRWPTRFSWTVVLMAAGLVIGCVSAWLRIRGDR